MSISGRILHVANCSNKNIKIGKWFLPARSVSVISGIDDSLKNIFDLYVSRGDLYITNNFMDAVFYLKQHKAKIDINAILGRKDSAIDNKNADNNSSNTVNTITNVNDVDETKEVNGDCCTTKEDVENQDAVNGDENNSDETTPIDQQDFEQKQISKKQKRKHKQ